MVKKARGWLSKMVAYCVTERMSRDLRACLRGAPKRLCLDSCGRRTNTESRRATPNRKKSPARRRYDTELTGAQGELITPVSPDARAAKEGEAARAGRRHSATSLAIDSVRSYYCDYDVSHRPRCDERLARRDSEPRKNCGTLIKYPIDYAE